jgi:hypothetical protein
VDCVLYRRFYSSTGCSGFLISAPLMEPTANSVKGIQLDDGSFDAGGCGLDKGSDESKR